MPKQVKVEGKIITVPDDATPDEIDALASGGSTPTAPAVAPGGPLTLQRLQQESGASHAMDPATIERKSADEAAWPALGMAAGAFTAPMVGSAIGMVGGGAGRLLAAHPRTVGGIAGAIHGYSYGGVPGAISEGAAGIMGGSAVGKIGRLAKLAGVFEDSAAPAAIAAGPQTAEETVAHLGRLAPGARDVSQSALREARFGQSLGLTRDQILKMLGQ